MPTVQFLGNVHPRCLNVSINGMPTVNWAAEELGLEMAFKFEIINSNVCVWNVRLIITTHLM